MRGAAGADAMAGAAGSSGAGSGGHPELGGSAGLDGTGVDASAAGGQSGIGGSKDAAVEMDAADMDNIDDRIGDAVSDPGSGDSDDAPICPSDRPSGACAIPEPYTCRYFVRSVVINCYCSEIDAGNRSWDCGAMAP
jgi:hypothetical protein